MGALTQGGMAFGAGIGSGMRNYRDRREKRNLLEGKAGGIKRQLMALQQEDKLNEQDAKLLKSLDNLDELGAKKIQSLVADYETGQELKTNRLKMSLLESHEATAALKLGSMRGLQDFQTDMPGMEDAFPEDSRWSVPEYLTQDYADRPAEPAPESGVAAGAFPGDYWGNEIKPIYEDVVMPPLPPGFETSQRTGRGPTRRELAVQNFQENYPGEEVNPMFQVSEPVGGMKKAHETVDAKIQSLTEKIEEANAGLGVHHTNLRGEGSEEQFPWIGSRFDTSNSTQMKNVYDEALEEASKRFGSEGTREEKEAYARNKVEEKYAYSAEEIEELNAKEDRGLVPKYHQKRVWTAENVGVIDEMGISGRLDSVDKGRVSSGLWSGGPSGLGAKVDKWSRDQQSKAQPKYSERRNLSKLLEEYEPQLAAAEKSKYALDHPEEYPSGFKGSVVDYEEEGAEVLPPVEISDEGRVRRVLKGYDTSGMNERIDAEQRAVDFEPKPEPLPTGPVEGVTKGTDIMSMNERRAELVDSLAKYGLTPQDREQAIKMINEKYPQTKVATEYVTAGGESIGYDVGGTFVKSPRGGKDKPQGWRLKSVTEDSDGKKSYIYENPRNLPTYVPTASKYAQGDSELTLTNENAPSEGQAKEFNTAAGNAKKIQEDAKRLIELTKDKNWFQQRVTDRAFMAEVSTTIATMRGMLRPILIGPGAMSDIEQKMLSNALPDPSDFFRLDAATLQRFATLGDLVGKKMKFHGESIGLWEYNRQDEAAQGPAAATSAADPLNIGL